MIIGHAAVALLGRSRHFSPALILLLCAAYFADLLEILLRAAGMDALTAEQRSHNLLVLVAGAAVLAVVALARNASPANARLVIAVTLSHAPLDWITGTDKPLLWAFGPQVGLRLYRYPALDAVLEASLFIIAWIVCVRSRRPSRAGLYRAVLVLAVLGQMAYSAYSGHRPFRRFVRRTFRPMIHAFPATSSLSPRPLTTIPRRPTYDYSPALFEGIHLRGSQRERMPRRRSSSIRRSAICSTVSAPESTATSGETGSS